MSNVIYIPRNNIPAANSKYGLLYPWETASDARGFVAGWHLPSFSEFMTLGSFVEDGDYAYSPDAGGKLKETGYVYWNSPNTGATNELGFNARGAGFRGIPLFSNMKLTGVFHCSTLGSGDYSDWNYVLDLIADYEDCYIHLTSPKQGLSVRLIKNDSTDPGFVDIDGKRYLTVKIGSHVWMAENLQAIRFANGDPLTEVTDNTAWIADDGVKKYCAFNNNHDNI